MKEQFKNIIGYQTIKEELGVISDIIQNPEKYHQVGIYTPKGLLLHGVPGTGKTTMANALINSTNRKCYVIRKNNCNGDFVKIINNTFEEAKENAPSIVLLDDMDKFSNTGSKNKNSDEFVAIQTAIDGLQKSEVFVIATVNDLYYIPNSLLRTGRFDKIIEVDLPNKTDARKIIEYYLSTKKNIGVVDYDLITSVMRKKSCSDLKTIINEAGIISLYNNKDKIDTFDIVSAFLKIIFKSYKKVNSLSLETRKHMAYHEAGHAILSEVLKPGSVNFISVLYTNDNGAAITSTGKTDDYVDNEKDLENNILISLAGKAATDVCLGLTDFGCVNDLEKAYGMVRFYIDELAGCGFNLSNMYNIGSNIKDNSDTVINVLVEILYKKCKKIILDNRFKIEQIVALLINEDFVLGNDIRKIIKGEYENEKQSNR